MISQFFINRPRFAIVIAILFLFSGMIALFTLPVALYPNITPSLITVSTRYPGADAQTVLNTVVQPIESQINGVKRMIYMSSTATDDGSASIKVYFDIGTNGDENTVNTQNRVNWAQAQLTPGRFAAGDHHEGNLQQHAGGRNALFSEKNL